MPSGQFHTWQLQHGLRAAQWHSQHQPSNVCKHGKSSCAISWSRSLDSAPIFVYRNGDYLLLFPFDVDKSTFATSSHKLNTTIVKRLSLFFKLRGLGPTNLLFSIVVKSVHHRVPRDDSTLHDLVKSSVTLRTEIKKGHIVHKSTLCRTCETSSLAYTSCKSNPQPS